jgi:hypothetical protein
MPNIDNDKRIILQNIFLPHTKRLLEEMKVQKGKFVHYTSAENAINIIRTKKIWMRNTKCMNDYMEVVHGYNLLREFFSKNRKLFDDVLEPFGKEMAKASLYLFDRLWKQIEENTFITCTSKHETDENTDGRLSMWRAYGQTTEKAAIVLNMPFGIAKGLRLILSPVYYDGYDGLEKRIKEIMENIKSNTKYLLTLNVEENIQAIFGSLVINVLSIKYKGFEEEKEWRVIHLPNPDSSKLISHSIEIINGIPQSIYQVPLEENPEENVLGMDIPQLVERIIIGPTNYPVPMRQAFIAALRNAGVENPESKVFESQIPLRT